MHTGVPPVALHQPDPLADALRLRGQRLTRGGDHRRVLLDPGHLMTEPGQPQRLRALTHPDVEHPQPLSDREPPGYLLVELPGHQLLPYDITQVAQLVQPRVCRTPGESVSAQGRSPRLTCGFGSRSRRIWRERIRA
ncbi:hypothetical protein GCM10010260_08960 [Streptomyces filipinensis]|uniref:Uncharacterized protein n=1 Tax=Streptomyces filipinensis TaxID=66887 RepID=A0A918M967_9ACTN|nr:hypothetical protein GCM10010260_08960 [Streptomyces filipinensis]